MTDMNTIQDNLIVATLGAAAGAGFVHTIMPKSQIVNTTTGILSADEAKLAQLKSEKAVLVKIFKTNTALFHGIADVNDDEQIARALQDFKNNLKRYKSLTDEDWNKYKAGTLKFESHIIPVHESVIKGFAKDSDRLSLVREEISKLERSIGEKGSKVIANITKKIPFRTYVIGAAIGAVISTIVFKLIGHIISSEEK